MYGTNEQVSSINAFFPIGVDVIGQFKGISFEKMGINYALCTHWDSEGIALKDPIFDVSLSSVKPFANETKEAAFEREKRNTNSKITHILSQFCTLQELEDLPLTETLQDFAGEVEKILANKNLDVDLYIKVCKSPKGFPVLPINAKIPFLQKVSSGPCKLAYTEKEKKAVNTVTKFTKTAPVPNGDGPGNAEAHHSEVPEAPARQEITQAAAEKAW